MQIYSTTYTIATVYFSFSLSLGLCVVLLLCYGTCQCLSGQEMSCCSVNQAQY